MGGTIKVVRAVRVGAVAACAGMCSSAFAAGPSFTIIPPRAGEINTVVNAVSGNGQFFVGGSNIVGGGTRFWMWTPDGGRVDLATTPGLAVERSIAISNNGTIAGDAVKIGPPVTPTAIRRALGQPSAQLGTLVSGGQTYNAINAAAISDDGSTVIGEARSADRWQAWVSRNGSAPAGLGWLPGTPQDYSTAQAVNADGSVIVGTSTLAGAAVEFREGVVRLLPDPSADVLQSNAYAVTSNAQYIAGTASRGDIEQMSAVIWGPDRVPLDLGRPSPNGVRVNGIADTGTLVAVSTGIPGSSTGDAFLWNPTGGFQRLVDFAAAHGVLMPSDLIGNEIRGMSRDGTTFVGDGRNGAGVMVGWVLTVPGVGVPSVGLAFATLWSSRRRRRD